MSVDNVLEAKTHLSRLIDAVESGREQEACRSFTAIRIDRLRVAQALEEPMRFLTHDAVAAGYSDTIIHV